MCNCRFVECNGTGMRSPFPLKIVILVGPYPSQEKAKSVLLYFDSSGSNDVRSMVAESRRVLQRAFSPKVQHACVAP